MTDRISRVALAGFGAWGQMHARALVAIAESRLVGVYCHGEASARAAAEQLPDVPRFDNYERMLAAGGFDVVSVAVPNHAHSRFACLALEAGAHVFLEKPVGLTLAECDAVAAAAARAGRQVAVNHELRVSHQWKAVRDLIANGDIGSVRYQHLSLFRNSFRRGSGGWRYDAALVGSWALEELVHYVDLVAWYAAENGRPIRLKAVGNGADGGLIRNFTATLEWENGAVAVVSQCLSGFEQSTLLEVAGTTGAVRTWWAGAMDRTLHPEFSLKVRRGDHAPETLTVPQSGEVFELEANLRRALAGFRDHRSVFSPQEARLAVELCLAADQSCRTGATVTLPR